MKNSLEEWCRYGILTEEVCNICHQQPSIPVIRNVTTIVYTSNQVFQSIPRSIFILVQVDTEEILRDLQGNCVLPNI